MYFHQSYNWEEMYTSVSYVYAEAAPLNAENETLIQQFKETTRKSIR